MACLTKSHWNKPFAILPRSILAASASNEFRTTSRSPLRDKRYSGLISYGLYVYRGLILSRDPQINNPDI